MPRGGHVKTTGGRVVGHHWSLLSAEKELVISARGVTAGGHGFLN